MFGEKEGREEKLFEVSCFLICFLSDASLGQGKGGREEEAAGVGTIL